MQLYLDEAAEPEPVVPARGAAIAMQDPGVGRDVQVHQRAICPPDGHLVPHKTHNPRASAELTACTEGKIKVHIRFFIQERLCTHGLWNFGFLVLSKQIFAVCCLTKPEVIFYSNFAFTSRCCSAFKPCIIISTLNFIIFLIDPFFSHFPIKKQENFKSCKASYNFSWQQFIKKGAKYLK